MPPINADVMPVLNLAARLDLADKSGSHCGAELATKLVCDFPPELPPPTCTRCFPAASFESGLNRRCLSLHIAAPVPVKDLLSNTELH